jgi:hypothetical protein
MSKTKKIKNEIVKDKDNDNENENENENDNDFKLINAKILKQQKINYELSVKRFLKSNGLIKLSY